MSVYLRGGVYYYSFRYRGIRHRKSTGQTNPEDAELVEAQAKIRARKEAAGIAVLEVKDSPRIAEWAGVYYEAVERNPDISRPERVDDLLRVALRFWGQAPTKDPRAGEPYHDLRLLDPVIDPMWVEKYERWMAKKPWAGQTRNQYRSVMRQLYEHARRFRGRTGVESNPFDALPRDKPVERTVTLTVDELRRWIAHASYHVRLAIAIAALAPKLRLSNVLALKWTDVDEQLQRIVVHAHKTAAATRRPLVSPVRSQLAAILEDAKRRRRRRSTHVVEYRGKPIASIRGGLRLAAERAGLVYGRTAGITFHTIRHTMATMLAELGEPEALRKDVMGHKRIDTTQRYTHIRPVHQEAALERLSAATPLLDLVTMPWRRASATRAVAASEPGPIANSEKA